MNVLNPAIYYIIIHLMFEFSKPYEIDFFCKIFLVKMIYKTPNKKLYLIKKLLNYYRYYLKKLR